MLNETNRDQVMRDIIEWLGTQESEVLKGVRGAFQNRTVPLTRIDASLTL